MTQTCGAELPHRADGLVVTTATVSMSAPGWADYQVCEPDIKMSVCNTDLSRCFVII